ncbi:MAG: AarF/UbiB family protein [Bacteroidota bacterium]
MPKRQRIFLPSVRKRKAYWTATLVFFSYISLHFRAKFFGKAYQERRIKALHQKNADRIRRRVQELQGLFIKFGQLISNLSNALPEEFRAPLEELQDHIKAKPYEEVEQTILAEFGQKPEALFTHFEKTPLAAASVGQVHRARIERREVVVKVQHANIEVIAAADLTILKNLVRLHAFFMNVKGLDHTYLQVRQMIEEELDYRKEAISMQRIAENLKTVPELRVRIPEIYPEFNRKKVLVASYCEGVNIGQVEQLKAWEIDVEELAERLLELYCKMILVDGFYHADPHPGNILVNEFGEIILLDFGAVAKLSDSMKNTIPNLIEAVVRNDTEATVQALRKMGFIGSDRASQQYVEQLIDTFRAFLREEVELDGLNFQNVQLKSGLSSIATLLKKVDLRDISNAIQIPKDYILLNRTIVLLLGNSFQLAPKLDTLEVVKPYMKQHVLSNSDSITQLIVSSFKNHLSTAISLPSEIARLLKTANKGELEYEVKGLNQRLDRFFQLGQQFLYALLSITALYFLLNYPSPEGTLAYYINWGLLVVFTFTFLRAFFYRHRNN